MKREQPNSGLRRQKQMHQHIQALILKSLGRKILGNSCNFNAIILQNISRRFLCQRNAASGNCINSLKTKLAACFSLPPVDNLRLLASHAKLLYVVLCYVINVTGVFSQLRPQCTRFCHRCISAAQHPAAWPSPSAEGKSNDAGSNSKARGNAGTGTIMLKINKFIQNWCFHKVYCNKDFQAKQDKDMLA